MKCIYLYTTWDRNFPYGCKGMGIKSSRLPAEVVKESSGQECLAYVEKTRKIDTRAEENSKKY